MIEAPAPLDELDQLLNALCNGSLDQPQSQRLQTLAGQDTQSRDRYVDYLRVHANLQWHFRDDVIDRSSLTARSRSDEPAPRRRAKLLGSVLAVAAAFYGAFVLISWNLRDKQLAAEKPAPQVATLGPTHNATWSPATVRRLADGAIQSGELLELSSGLSQLTLTRGTTLVVQGPAAWTIDGNNRATLRHGKVVAKVPSGAIGFTLDTPTARIVDLGTEFGASADAQGATHVQVFVGEVQLSPQSTDRNRPQSAGIVRLRAGEAGAVATDRAIAINVPAVQFTRTVAVKSKPLFRRVEHGGTFGKHNLAREPGAKAFASSWLDARPVGPQFPAHRPENLNDGQYGNQFSWLAKSGDRPFAGINLDGNRVIGSIAFGRDNGGDELTPDKQDYDDFWEGVYTLQYTAVANPSEATPDDAWHTIGTVEYLRGDELVKAGFLKPMLRHRYAFAPVEATAVRILVPGAFGSAQPTIIDELEVYEE